MVVVLSVDLVEGGGDDPDSFINVAFDPCVVAEARGDGFGHGHR